MKRYIIPKMEICDVTLTTMVNLSTIMPVEDSDDLILDAKKRRNFESADNIWEEY